MSSLFLLGFHVVVQHLAIFVSHPSIETLLLVVIDLGGTVIGDESDGSVDAIG